MPLKRTMCWSTETLGTLGLLALDLAEAKMLSESSGLFFSATESGRHSLMSLPSVREKLNDLLTQRYFIVHTFEGQGTSYYGSFSYLTCLMPLFQIGPKCSSLVINSIYYILHKGKRLSNFHFLHNTPLCNVNA